MLLASRLTGDAPSARHERADPPNSLVVEAMPAARLSRSMIALAMASALLAACGGGGGGGSGASEAATAQPAGETTPRAPAQNGSGGNSGSSNSTGESAESAAPPAGSGTAVTTPTAPSGGTPEPVAVPPAVVPPVVVPPVVSPPTVQPTSARDAVRLADQASFGPNEALVAEIRTQGPGAWIAAQMSLSSSRYTLGGGADVHQWTGAGAYCQPGDNTCWRDKFSTQPLLWDFYRNATAQPDQLRQRVAFALGQIVVVSGVELSGTYGFREYHNNLLDLSFGNYRQVLKKVALSPLMGDYLDNVNNDKTAPNENFAREMLQLFSLGTCLLNADGSMQGGSCTPTFDNATVRAYAYALTGWTYPAGGRQAWSCSPAGTNCRFYQGDMTPVPARHDTAARTLLGGRALAAGHTAPVALDAVLDSLMAHPNMGPFIGRQLIQHLVTSNPSPAYIARVSAAFDSGRYQSFGAGQKGDLAATVAAVLLDGEARNPAPARSSGKLREPVLMMTGVLRALNGRTDGETLAQLGDGLRQQPFRAPSVFNFYPPEFPVAGTTLNGPQFALHNANSALERLNFLTTFLDWGGTAADGSVPQATGTKVDLDAFLSSASDAGALVDRLSMLMLGETLPAATRTPIVNATAWWTSSRDANNWRVLRVRMAAFLVLSAPQYQVHR